MAGYDKSTLMHAKQLRVEMTPAELKLWSILRNRRLDEERWRRQQPIGPFIVDFVCHARRLVIEADGGQHAESLSDQRRTAFLDSAGYRVLRFWNNEIMNNAAGVAQAISNSVAPPHPARALRESPSPSRGEGNGAPNA